jgi:L-2-hydroxyglutarate oxidase
VRGHQDRDVTSRHDVAVVGAGILGLATARSLITDHGISNLVVIDKEPGVARHQTGHNSGVIHSGLYYAPGSLKARLCRQGVDLLLRFCEETDTPYQLCGKVVVATNIAELPALERLWERGSANGVPALRRLTPGELAEIEPHATGIAALHSPTTGIVDFHQVSESLARSVAQSGAEILTDAEVRSGTKDGNEVVLETTRGEVRARFVVNMAGLQSDLVARRLGLRPRLAIVPFRGEYRFVRPIRQGLVRGLIYPVPDPRFPFLGVHLTRTIDGRLHAGPNAVLAFAREGYERWSFDVRDLARILSFAGSLRMAARYWRTGLEEYRRSFSRRAFAAAIARLVPGIGPADLVPAPAGVRAQAVARDGSLVDDFALLRTDRAVHVLNAPSPAATASLAIGRYVAGIVRDGIESLDAS